MALVAVFSVAFLFRYQIANGFTVLNGNRYDQIIEVSILDHWFNTFRGIAHWSEAAYFFPAKKSLGYNDGYFIYGLIYSGFRLLRFDPFLAGECVSIVVRFIGFIGFYLACRRLLDLRPGWATLGAVLFTLSNNLFIQAHHAQLISVGFAPVIAVLVDASLHSLRAERRLQAFWWGASAACLYAAWLLTAFYMAWFFAFFCAATGVAYAVLAGPAALRHALSTARRHALPLTALLAVFALAVSPFLSVYLSKAAETGMHPYRAAKIHTLSLPDLLELGHGNLLYGQALTLTDHLLRPDYPAWTERMTGLPPMLLFLFACGLAMLVRPPPSLGAGQVKALRAMAIASLVTWACTFNVAGHSLWWLVFNVVPGAKATRVVARYQIFVTAPVIAIAVTYLASSARTTVGPVLALICAMLVLEEVNVVPLVALDRRAELARLNAVPVPPAGCTAFFTATARPGRLLDDDLDGFFSHNVDAMMIAETLHLPTINGASTFQPPRWNLVDPAKPDYLDRVRRYAVANGLNSLCSLDLKTMSWDRVSFSGPVQAMATP